MRELKLTFIGSGNAFSPAGLCCNGFLVNDRFLFESPPQALSSLNTLGFDANALDAVIISHHHGDHFLGLPFLLLHWKYKGRQRPVTIIGPRSTETLGRMIAETVFPGVFDVLFEINWLEAEPNRPLSVAGLDLDPLSMQHDDRLAMSLGYAARLGGRKFGYTGDTTLCDSVLGLARDSEVLISECASRDQKIPIHMNLVDDMPAVRSAMPNNSALILTHIDSAVTADGLPNTAIAEDFRTYRF
jgi:ribonuclease BN (tRNA processing enzyme)